MLKFLRTLPKDAPDQGKETERGLGFSPTRWSRSHDSNWDDKQGKDAQKVTGRVRLRNADAVGTNRGGRTCLGSEAHGPG